MSRSEKDQTLDAVYGVGIIQQSNVVRAMAELGALEDYPYSRLWLLILEIFIPSGPKVGQSAPKLTKNIPPMSGSDAALYTRSWASGLWEPAHAFGWRDGLEPSRMMVSGSQSNFPMARRGKYV